MSQCAPLLSTVKQVGAIVESTCGAGGSFVAADFKFRSSAATLDAEIEFSDDDTYSATLSPKKKVPGARKATAKIAGKLVGSGVAGTVPESDIYFRGCGMASVVVKNITIGAVTDGPFLPGEIVTQTGSSATGRVMKAVSDGTTVLPIVEVSGTWASSGAITGGTSGATATGSSLPTAVGFAYHPITSSKETVAIRLEEDGRYKELNGGTGTFAITAESSGPAKVEFTIVGKKGTFGDASFTSSVTFHSSEYPVFSNAQLVLDRGLVTEFTPVVKSIAVDLQGENPVRKDANATDSTGYIAGSLTKRTPQIVTTAEAMLASEFDIYSAMLDADVVTEGFQFTAPDNNVWIWGTNGQIIANPEGDQDGFATMDLTLQMNGSAGDDELWIVFTT